MKGFKWFLFVFLIISILFVAISFFLPSTVKFERKITADASEEIVYNQVNNLKNWKNWSAWALRDTSIFSNLSAYSVKSEGVGATFSWKSDDDELDKGKIKITKSIPFKTVELEMLFGFTEAMSYWNIQPYGKQIEITWGINVNLGFNPFSKWSGMFLEDAFVSDIESGLENLKNYAQEYPIINSGLASKRTNNILQWFISVRDSVRGKKINTIHTKLLNEVEQYVKSDSNVVVLYPIVVYHYWSDTMIDIEAGILIKDSIFTNSSRVKLNHIPKGNVITATHYGAYERMPETYFSINEWMRKNKAEITGAPWEIYKVDPSVEQNPSKWVTEIYFPIK